MVLISEHGDGEIAARAAESMGYRTIRGSSRRGAERALLSLAREVEGGSHVAVTPDGPRGPAESFAPGALIAAQRSGAPIVLLRAVVDRAWRLNSWDRFIIPKPFARVTIYVGEPMSVQRRVAARGGGGGAAISDRSCASCRSDGGGCGAHSTGDRVALVERRTVRARSSRALLLAPASAVFGADRARAQRALRSPRCFPHARRAFPR